MRGISKDEYLQYKAVVEKKHDMKMVAGKETELLIMEHFSEYFITPPTVATATATANVTGKEEGEHEEGEGSGNKEEEEAVTVSGEKNEGNNSNSNSSNSFLRIMPIREENLLHGEYFVIQGNPKEKSQEVDIVNGNETWKIDSSILPGSIYILNQQHQNKTAHVLIYTADVYHMSMIKRLTIVDVESY
jgi:hypothetical protein